MKKQACPRNCGHGSVVLCAKSTAGQASSGTLDVPPAHIKIQQFRRIDPALLPQVVILQAVRGRKARLEFLWTKIMALSRYVSRGSEITARMIVGFGVA